MHIVVFCVTSIAMARPLRITYDGAVYHVTIRGVEQRAIFRSNRDRERFVTTLAESVRLYDIRLYLFCCMTNHVHLVCETPQSNLSRFMHRLQTAYTVYFNRRHQRAGHLFQGRFGAKLVEQDEYILKLSRYVHLNPVFIKAHEEKSNKERIEVLRHYPWSSYRSYIGLSTRLDYVDYAPVLSMMGGPKKKQSVCYRRFVEGGIRYIDQAFIETKRQSRLCIGSDDRTKEMYLEMLQAHGCKEDASFRRGGKIHAVDDVLATTLEILGVSRDSLLRRSRNSMVRPLVAYALCRYTGCTQRAAAAVMGGCSGVAISQQLKKLHTQLASDKKLKSMVRRLSDHFS
ncbi:transposase [Planctomycetota bacterium]